MRRRHLILAQWHAREALAHASVGNDDSAEHHLFAADEFLALATGRRPDANPTLPDVSARIEIEIEKESCGV